MIASQFTFSKKKIQVKRKSWMRITNVKIITMDGMRPGLAVQNTTFLHNTRTLLIFTLNFEHPDTLTVKSLTALVPAAMIVESLSPRQFSFCQSLEG